MRNGYASNHTGLVRASLLLMDVDGSTNFIPQTIGHNGFTIAQYNADQQRGTYQSLFSRNDDLVGGEF